MRWLVITLAAPLASFAVAAGNVRRGSAGRPGRSVLLGLAGAALGVDRENVAGQAALTAGFFTATRTIRPGVPITDFHTFQSRSHAHGQAATRAAALARPGDLETSITRRDYRADGLWQAAYFCASGGEIALETLEGAFKRPEYMLWLGRKSCPLAHPLAPKIIEADDVADAFLGQALLAPAPERWVYDEVVSDELAVDVRIVAAGWAKPPSSARSERRIDEPGDRVSWQFSERQEQVYRMPARGSVGAASA